MPPFLILASHSPRRRELLAEAGYRFEVIAPDEDVECGVCSEAGPAGLVTEMAFRKAAAVVRKLQSDPRIRADEWKSASTGSRGAVVVVGADTVAECGGLILGKPRDEADARRMLSQLSGREHRVLTGLCVWPLGSPTPHVRVAVSTLRMDQLSRAELDDYLAGGQWVGKAGGFGYQDRLGWVHVVRGSESNVVGLPLELLAEMIAELPT